MNTTHIKAIFVLLALAGAAPASALMHDSLPLQIPSQAQGTPAAANPAPVQGDLSLLDAGHHTDTTPIEQDGIGAISLGDNS